MLQIYEEQNVMIDKCILWVYEMISRSSILDLFGFVHRQVNIILFIILGEGEMVGVVEFCMLY